MPAEGPYLPIDVLGFQYLVPIPWWAPLAGLAVVGAVVGGALVFAAASGRAQSEVVAFR